MMKVTPQGLINEWSGPSWLRPKQDLELYLNNTPKLYLDKHPKIDWMPITDQFIPKGSTIFHATGEYFKQKEGINDVTMFSAVKGNYSCMCVDGFPNCEPTSFPYKGIQFPLMVALDDIPPGSPLCRDYGIVTHFKYTEPHVELVQRKLKALCYHLPKIVRMHQNFGI